MTEFEPLTSGAKSNRSANWATTTTAPQIFFLEFWQKSVRQKRSFN